MYIKTKTPHAEVIVMDASKDIENLLKAPKPERFKIARASSLEGKQEQSHETKPAELAASKLSMFRALDKADRRRIIEEKGQGNISAFFRELGISELEIITPAPRRRY